MLRIYKSYRLPYRIGGTGGNAALLVPSLHMTFPSYPALPFSLDDFYQTSAGMVRAAAVVISCNTAWAWGDRSTTACSASGGTMSET